MEEVNEVSSGKSNEANLWKMETRQIRGRWKRGKFVNDRDVENSWKMVCRDSKRGREPSDERNERSEKL